MSRFNIPSREETHPDTHAMLDGAKAMLGFTPNLFRLMAMNPKVLTGWAGLQSSLAQALDVRTRDAIALATTEVNDCTYCRMAHTYGATTFARIDAEEIELNRQGKSRDPKRAAAALFAKTVTETRGKVGDDALEAVRAAGFTDPEIVAIVGLVAQFQMTNLLNNVAQTTVDFPSVALNTAA